MSDNTPALSAYPLSPEQLELRASARRAVTFAVQSGALKREPCERCGASPTQGHHDDYSKPLEVRWLCQKHHLEVHREIGIPGRPRTGRPVRSVQIKVMVTPELDALITAAAAREGRSVSDWGMRLFEREVAIAAGIADVKSGRVRRMDSAEVARPTHGKKGP
jgi:ribosomal protein S27AE